MVVELRSIIKTRGHKNWIETSNSATLILIVCISIILSSSVLIAMTNIILIHNNSESNSAPEPPPEPNQTPDPNSESDLGWIVGIVNEISTSHERINEATVKTDEQSATTDAKGYYKIEVPAPGTYNLTALADTYYTQTVTNVFVDTQTTVVINFYLTLIPPQTEPVIEKHDIAVTIISSPAEAYQGQTIAIEVSLVNPGDFQETFSLEVTSESTSIGTRSVSLNPKHSKTEIFYWNTSNTSPSTYTLNVEAFLEGDEIPINNLANTSIVLKPRVGWIEGYVSNNETSLPIAGATVSANTYTAITDALGYYNIETASPDAHHVAVTANGYYNETKSNIFVDILGTANVNFTLKPIPTPPGKIHDIAITQLSAPSEVYLGNIAIINVSIKNLGDYRETFIIKILNGITSLISKTLDLDSRASTVLSFGWNTSNLTPSEYSITAEVILETDENPTNDQTATKISINLEQPEGTFTWVGSHVNSTLTEWAHNLSFQNIVVRYDSDQQGSMNNLAQYDIKLWRWVPYYHFENATTEKDFITLLQHEISTSVSKRIYIDDVDAMFMLYGASTLSSFLNAVKKVQHNNIILCFYMSNQTPYHGLYHFIDQYDWSKFHIDIYSPPYVDFSTLIPLVNARTLGIYLWLWPYGGLGTTWKNVSLNDVICRYCDAINHQIQRFAVWTGYEPETYEVGMNEASLYIHPHWWNKITKYNNYFLDSKPIPRDRGVILWFDYGLLNTYEVTRPILKRYGYTGVISAITWMVRNYENERYVWDDNQSRDKPIMTLQELLTMQNEGWEIVSHSQSHPHLGNLQEYYARWEIKGSKEWIDNHLGPMKNPCFVYPYGEVYWSSIVDQHYTYQRLGKEGQEPRMLWNPNSETPSNSIPIVGTDLSEEMIDYWLNETNQKGGIGVFVLHGIYEHPEPESLENYIETLDYLLRKLKELEIPVLTLTHTVELLQIKSQSSLSIKTLLEKDWKIEEITVKNEIADFRILPKLTIFYLNAACICSEAL
ncbi:carboxypeptidase regulatory-like domain-containing protein, partial [Candidatus Bathyarchaeota archaeon]|nr:carboxypeptidase regulatory-like domain-containing protein [Candidatus Bathyarchaeota archaeon]